MKKNQRFFFIKIQKHARPIDFYVGRLLSEAKNSPL
jgi:hypothetical protein